MDKLYSVLEAAELLGLSHWTLRTYIKARKLNPVRIGKRVLLETSELERFIKQSRVASDPL
jgi:excisionase family DNA binding protein